MADPASLRQLPAAVAADPQVQRMATYLATGLRAEALREGNDVRERYKNDPLALYALALYWRDLGLYQHATQAAVRVAALGPSGGTPLFLERMAYPTYFSDLVEAEAAARGLDPFLIYSLIRQESFFERGARSSAAAQGLTQVIPSTAEYIAGAIGWPNFQPDDIYKPYVNIKFGTYYLWAALSMFDGNPYPALAGYNAGPGNAQYWFEQANTPTTICTSRRSQSASRRSTCGGCWPTLRLTSAYMANKPGLLNLFRVRPVRLPRQVEESG